MEMLLDYILAAFAVGIILLMFVAPLALFVYWLFRRSKKS